MVQQTFPLFQLGRYFFAIGIAFFGFQYLFYGHYLGGLPPIPPWAPGGTAGAYLIGVTLVAAAIAIATTPKLGGVSAFVVAAIFLASVVFLHTPHMHDILFNGNDRTRALEPLSLAGAAFVLAALLAVESGQQSFLTHPALRQIGIALFALTLPVYGWQHFEYLRFLVTLLPAWMPAHAFLIGFTGTAFVAAGLAILFRVLARLAAIWLGIMFLLWTILLHAPRVAAHLHNGDEWTSAFVALAMCGASWIIAASVSPTASN